MDQPRERRASIARTTRETDVRVTLNLDGKGTAQVSTGVPFLDHMLILMAGHGLFDLSLHAKGDVEVDCHHTVEDVGLCLGEAFRAALGDKEGIRRYGHAQVPMDEALAAVTIDLSGRPYLVFKVHFAATVIGAFETQLAKEFFRAFATEGRLTCHIHRVWAENDHHLLEAIFKALGRALDQATGLDPRVRGVPSTKGVL